MRGRGGDEELEEVVEEPDEESSDELEEYRERGSRREDALDRAESRSSLVACERRVVCCWTSNLKTENEVGR